MASEQKQTSDSRKQERSFKKKLALAAVTASLGLSLGVPVGDALAGDETSYGGGTLGITTDDFKTVLESKQGKFKTGIESRQGKFKSGTESRQGKIKTGIESRQGKFKPGQGAINSVESAQIKIDTQLDSELDAESFNVEE